MVSERVLPSGSVNQATWSPPGLSLIHIYRGIDEDLGGKRQSAVLSYSPVGAAPTRPVALPHRYADELRRAYRALGLQRPEVPAVTPSGSSELRVDIAPPSGLATLVVHRVGDDLARVVARHRRDLCATGIQIVHVELPLSDPATCLLYTSRCV